TSTGSTGAGWWCWSTWCGARGHAARPVPPGTAAPTGVPRPRHRDARPAAPPGAADAGGLPVLHERHAARRVLSARPPRARAARAHRGRVRPPARVERGRRDRRNAGGGAAAGPVRYGAAAAHRPVIETCTHLSLALARAPWVAVATMVVFGSHASPWGILSVSWRQRVVPDALRGRVNSGYYLFAGGRFGRGRARRRARGPRARHHGAVLDRLRRDGRAHRGGVAALHPGVARPLPAPAGPRRVAEHPARLVDRQHRLVLAELLADRHPRVLLVDRAAGRRHVEREPEHGSIASDSDLFCSRGLCWAHGPLPHGAHPRGGVRVADARRRRGAQAAAQAGGAGRRGRAVRGLA